MCVFSPQPFIHTRTPTHTHTHTHLLLTLLLPNISQLADRWGPQPKKQQRQRHKNKNLQDAGGIYLRTGGGDRVLGLHLLFPLFVASPFFITTFLYHCLKCTDVPHIQSGENHFLFFLLHLFTALVLPLRGPEMIFTVRNKK